MTAKLKLFLNARFTKLPTDIDTSITKLIGISVTNFEDLPHEFVDSDTELMSGGHYQLPKKGKCIVLTLLTRNSMVLDIWFDIRRWTCKRETMYYKHIGTEIQIIIKNKT